MSIAAKWLVNGREDAKLVERIEVSDSDYARGIETRRSISVNTSMPIFSI
jgi:hypothetical protein